ncbi:hypothetical protein [Rhodopirellula halodulae]|uniref:hypothetical protein n=1 Tax=Rhodopirellula halodulae TaxID=2894198 RepID=UPI001E49F8D3|nr:hypothetical protein [Rhodopirellula sp. JC737]
MIDYLDPASDCEVCWLSAAGLARLVGISSRTAKRHIAVISELGIFTVKKFKKRTDAVEYCESQHGFVPKFNKTLRDQAPNLYILNSEHPFWSGASYRLPKSVDEALGSKSEDLKKLWKKRSEATSSPEKVVSPVSPGSSVTGVTREEKPLDNDDAPLPQVFSPANRQPRKGEPPLSLPQGRPVRGSRELNTTSPPNRHYEPEQIRHRILKMETESLQGSQSEPEFELTFECLDDDSSCSGGGGPILNEEEKLLLESQRGSILSPEEESYLEGLADQKMLGESEQSPPAEAGLASELQESITRPQTNWRRNSIHRPVSSPVRDSLIQRIGGDLQRRDENRKLRDERLRKRYF